MTSPDQLNVKPCIALVSVTTELLGDADALAAYLRHMLAQNPDGVLLRVTPASYAQGKPGA